MQKSEPHMQIARKIRSVETAKIGLVEQVAEVFRSIQSGSEHDVVCALGDLVGLAYYLGAQLDISFAAIEREAAEALPKAMGNDPLDVADYEAVRRYLDSKR